MQEAPPSNTRDRTYLDGACSFMDHQQPSPDWDAAPLSPLLFTAPTAETFLTPLADVTLAEEFTLVTPPHLPTPPDSNEEASLKVALFNASLPAPGDLTKPERLRSFAEHRVTEEVGRKIQEFKEANSSVATCEIAVGWCSAVLSSMGQIRPPFGLARAEHMVQLAKQLLAGQHFVLCTTDVRMLELILTESWREQCETLVRIASARNDLSQRIDQSAPLYQSAPLDQAAPGEQAQEIDQDPFDLLLELDSSDSFSQQTMLELPTAEVRKEKSTKERQDGNIRCKNGTLTLTKEMNALFQEFVAAREAESGVALTSGERTSLRCWVYKELMKLGAKPVMRNILCLGGRADVFIGVVSENQFEKCAAKWTVAEPRKNMLEEGKAVFHFRPLIMRFFASKCQPFQDDDTPLRNELVVARDENIAKE